MPPDYEEIKNIICPIFKEYQLQTNKRLDFNDFYKVVIIKKEKGNKLTQSEKSLIQPAVLLKII